MKRVTIPMSDNLVKLALVNAEQNIDGLIKSGSLDTSVKFNLSYTHFDYLGLIGIFSGDYKVTIEISQNDFDAFASKHGVDFPSFTDLEMVDIEGEEDGEKEEEDKDEELKLKFIHLAYIEDDELTFALKSNVQLPGFEDLGDSDDDDDIKFTSYKGGKPGEVVSHKGTPFIAVPTSFGWVIINDGVVVEEIKF